MTTIRSGHPRHPAWLRRALSSGAKYGHTAGAVQSHLLHTICQEARCPNRSECWGRGTATFLILGDVCTRRCAFCSVKTGHPMGRVDASEPERVAEAVERLELGYVVVTSVDRDDLPDKGAGHFRAVIEAIRRRRPQAGIEILTPDFRGALEAAISVLTPLAPFVWAHNVETVPRLYPAIKRGARYAETLELLRRVKAEQDDRRRAQRQAPRIVTKSSIMLGLGERDEEVRATLADLRDCGVDVVTIGQYMQPTRGQTPVVEFIRPEKFDWWADEARRMGFRQVHSGPFVRSSYRAEAALALVGRH